MKEIITEIEQSMVKFLENKEMEELHNVFVKTLCSLKFVIIQIRKA